MTIDDDDLHLWIDDDPSAAMEAMDPAGSGGFSALFSSGPPSFPLPRLFPWPPLPSPPKVDDEKLKAFAASRGISTLAFGWEGVALLQAASEHPALAEARKVGRPKTAKSALAKLLGTRSAIEERDDNLVRRVAEIRQREKLGTDAEAIRLYIEEVEGILRTDPAEQHNFKSRESVIKTTVSKAKGGSPKGRRKK